jgi:NitT/TauT family transport system permease protein
MAAKANTSVIGSVPGWSRVRIGIWSVVVLVAFIGGWQIVNQMRIVHPIILPAPLDVGRALVDLVTSAAFPRHLWTTLYETGGGFLLGSSAGFLLALAVVLSPLLNRMLHPFIVALQVTPKIALAPLLITWLGFGSQSKIAQSTLLSFFPVFINAEVGLSKVDDNGLRMLRSLQANRWQIFKNLRLPNAMPATFVGLRVALTFAMIGAVVAEMIAAKSGLGLLLVQYQAGFKIHFMYAVILIMSMIGLVLFLAIAWVDRKVIFWREGKGGLL